MPLNLIHMNDICKHRTIFNITRKSGLALNAGTFFIGARCSGYEKKTVISYSYFNIFLVENGQVRIIIFFLHLSYQLIFFSIKQLCFF